MKPRLWGSQDKLSVNHRLKQREEAVWEQLVLEEYVRIFNLHLRLTGDREAAADLTQETFASAYASIGSFRGNCRAATWLYGVALNCNRNWRRAQSRHEPPDELDEELPDPTPTAHELAALRDQQERVYEAVRRLPEVYRRTVALRYFGGLSTAEIAAAEEVEEGTVRWRLHRALQKLWAMLQPVLGEENRDEQRDERQFRIAP
ncbi:MAG: RNA polymerase sigma factor [Candidatus Zipacnadales bacterium]